MKLTFRDLKQQKFTIEAEPSETVGQVKEKIAQEKGWEASQQKLIYSGKILQDANTIESYNIEEKGFIPKPAAGGPSTPAKAAPAATPSAPAPAPPATTAAAPQVPSTPTPASSGAAVAAGEAPAFNDPSALAMGTQGEAVIAQMEAMGFPRADIDRAMRAAFFNPDRAVDYLLNGIPQSAEQEQAQARAAATSPPAATTPAAAAATEATGDEPVNLFEAAAQAGGAAAQLIGQNQEQFLQLLAEDLGEEGELPPGAHEIRVTEEERDAIERLCRLGFSRDSVIQAYFACDKNEELAANFLFEQPDEGDDQ
ncbi:hypothetical protein ZTR_04045 [Talaromyces verruculosus]|nr:hypothetical protein ZTR_04045 [Talaromyces verruculosus]